MLEVTKAEFQKPFQYNVCDMVEVTKAEFQF